MRSLTASSRASLPSWTLGRRVLRASRSSGRPSSAATQALRLGGSRSASSSSGSTCGRACDTSVRPTPAPARRAPRRPGRAMRPRLSFGAMNCNLVLRSSCPSRTTRRSGRRPPGAARWTVRGADRRTGPAGLDAFRRGRAEPRDPRHHAPGPRRRSRLCREIRRPRRVPIVFLSARTGAAEIVVGLEAGADDYVMKPSSPPCSPARVRAACGARRRLDRLARTSSASARLTDRACRPRRPPRLG